MNLVVEYFIILYNSGRTSTASLLIALVIMISQYSIRFNQSRRVEEVRNRHLDVLWLVIQF
jgi:hypothetical protein